MWEIIGYKGIAEAHDGYLEIYINMGWLGLATLAGTVLSGYRHAVILHRTNPMDASLKLSLITAALMYSLTEAGFRMMTPMWMALLLQLVWVPAGLHAERPLQAVELRPLESMGRKQRVLFKVRRLNPLSCCRQPVILSGNCGLPKRQTLPDQLSAGTNSRLFSRVIA